MSEMNKSEMNGSLNASSHNKRKGATVSNDTSPCQDYHSQTSTKDVKASPENITWYDIKLYFVIYVDIFDFSMAFVSQF